MKELSVEQKAKRYDEAIEKLRRLHDDYDNVSTLIDVKEELENIFPELKENEDERIRKSLKILLQHFCKGYRVPGLDFPVSYKDMLTWLEKQGNQKSILDVEIPFSAKDSELQEATYYIPKGFYAEIDDDKVVIKKGEQKPTWSEEDEKKRILLINILKVNHPNDYFKVNPIVEELIDWLKALKDRYTWKPSDEQIIALRWVLNNVPYCKHKEEISELNKRFISYESKRIR